MMGHHSNHNYHTQLWMLVVIVAAIIMVLFHR